MLCNYRKTAHQMIFSVVRDKGKRCYNGPIFAINPLQYRPFDICYFKKIARNVLFCISFLIFVTLMTVLFYKIIQIDYFFMQMIKVVAVFNSLKVEERALFC